MTSLWEDFKPLKQRLAELIMMLAWDILKSFFAEVLNDPDAGINSRLDLQNGGMEIYFRDKPQGSFVLIDPAGKKDATMLQSIF